MLKDSVNPVDSSTPPEHDGRAMMALLRTRDRFSQVRAFIRVRESREERVKSRGSSTTECTLLRRDQQLIVERLNDRVERC